MSFYETKPAPQEEVIELRCIKKKRSRSGVYHYTRIRGEGYYVTLCGKILSTGQIELVFTPQQLCERCLGYSREHRAS